MTVTTAARLPVAATLLLEECADLQLVVELVSASARGIRLIGPTGERIDISAGPGHRSGLEQLLTGLRIDFDRLPVLVRGDSKDIRLLTPAIALARLLPTAYSFTHNRYGTVPGTEDVRARFAAEVFRAMADQPGPRHLASAFLGLVESSAGPLLAERRVEDCNLEVRVKRYHIGSPLHRYRYTDRHPTVRGAPLRRWTRFERPLVCFDWRHPLQDEEGVRLADEPLPDDYAAIWMHNPSRAKALARNTFDWLETRFAAAGLTLIDICFFIDRSGSVVYGEISPDCMRIRSAAADSAEALDKDQWRFGSTGEELLAKYQKLYKLVFGSDPNRQRQPYKQKGGF
jgi:phosphoribosylaminoimidazole-succinocarboxamide synthase